MNQRQTRQKQFYHMLLESQYWSADRMRDYQRDQLARLLTHARAQVPFYKNRLDVLFRGNEIDWERWGEVPILSRKDLVEHRDAMQAAMLPSGHGPTATSNSSGSTGVAITITVNALAGMAYDAIRWRVHHWNGLDWSKRLVNRMGDNQGPENWPEGKPIGPWGAPWDPATPGGFAWSYNSRIPSDVLRRVLTARHVPYLVTGPKIAHLLALDVKRMGEPLQLEAMLSMSGPLDDGDRAIVKEVLGARMIDHYGSKEAGQIASECSHGKLHFNLEAALFEVVDKDGRAAKPGQTGRLIATPFYYSAQPLIRYEQGDHVRLGDGCTCGSTLPTIDAVMGRTLAIFRHPDGRAILQIVPNSGRDLLDCQFWQMAQIGPNDYEIRYVPRDWSRIGNEGAFSELFRSLFFSDSAIRYKRVQGIPLTAAGKLLEYINEFHTGPRGNVR